MLVALIGCTTTPSGRKQLALLPETQMAEMGAAAFQQMKSRSRVLEGTPATRYVQCVADHLTAVVEAGHVPKSWEVELFDDEAVNAFALPGGKIGVYTGLLKVANNQHQLAAVLGHEIAHVIARHGNERVSQQLAANVGLQLAALLINTENSRDKQILMGALGLGAQFGVLMPFSRLQESEADQLGLLLMAKAGFDPRESIQLWKNMEKNSEGSAPPEFLSTHPSHETRIRRLRDALPEALTRFEQAQQQGRRPRCRRLSDSG